VCNTIWLSRVTWTVLGCGLLSEIYGQNDDSSQIRHTNTASASERSLVCNVHV